MKLKYKFIINDVADQKVAVAVGEGLTKFNGFIKMNDVGAAIFSKLADDITMEDLISKMAAEYPDEPAETVDRCVKEFVEKLKASDIVED